MLCVLLSTRQNNWSVANILFKFLNPFLGKKVKSIEWIEMWSVYTQPGDRLRIEWFAYEALKQSSYKQLSSQLTKASHSLCNIIGYFCLHSHESYVLWSIIYCNLIGQFFYILTTNQRLLIVFSTFARCFKLKSGPIRHVLMTFNVHAIFPVPRRKKVV